MAGELVTSSILISEDLINNIILNIDNKNPNKDLARQFWEDSKPVLIGMSSKVAYDIIKESHNHEKLRLRYNDIIINMTWQERNDFLAKGLDDLKKVNNQRIKEIVLINNLILLAVKALPLILAVL